MQILISVIINIIILAVALPLFYIYIVSRARERLERETTSKAREEIKALVKEFNNIALNRISILEDAINRANELLKKMNIDNKNNIEENSEYMANSLNIKIEDTQNLENIKEPEIKNTINNNEKNEKIEESKIIRNKTKKEFNNGLNRNGLDKESREELKNKLDLAIHKNLYNKNENKTENKNDRREIKITNNENIIKLYREGFSKEQISKKLNCAMTEIDIVIDMENIKK